MWASRSTLSAYESLAAAYDDLTCDHAHGAWLARVEDLAIDHGLAGGDVLDVACGTGKSFLPMLERGYRVTACDGAPAMATRAAAKAPAADVYVADMRDLGFTARRFDLVTCLDESLNQLPDEEALHDAFRAAAGVLRADGVYVFDLLTLRSFEQHFGRAWCRHTAQRMFVWEGCALETERPGCEADGVLDLFENGPDGTWTHRRIALAERHFPRGVVREALSAAGLECFGPYGMQADGSLYRGALEWRDTKAVYVARRR
jgi:SAM-dependent methyltransferase